MRLAISLAVQRRVVTKLQCAITLDQKKNIHYKLTTGKSICNNERFAYLSAFEASSLVENFPVCFDALGDVYGLSARSAPNARERERENH